MDDRETGSNSEIGTDSQRAAPLPARAAYGDARLIRSEELMQGQREVIILHNEQRYRLVVTRNGKLILQK